MKTRAAFTLVELLVVVAIIAVLLAILVPSLEDAVAAAQKGRCLANLKGIGLALGTYLNDSRRVYPRSPGWGALLGKLGNYGSYAQQDSDVRPLNPYLGYRGARAQVQIAQCPSDVGDPLSPGVFNAYDAYGTSYVETLTDYSGVMSVFGWKFENNQYVAIPPAKGQELEPTHNKILIGDYVYYGNRAWSNRMTRWHGGRYDPAKAVAEQTRQLNILLADMHAEFFSFDNGVIDNQADPANAGRAPNPSTGYW